MLMARGAPGGSLFRLRDVTNRERQLNEPRTIGASFKASF
jgi:hypothetical protein